MYIAKNLYQTTLKYVDMKDIDFFKLAIEQASNMPLVEYLSNLDVEEIKSNLTPVLFFSKLSKQTKFEDILVRKEIDWDRAQRKFIMLDIDYNEDEWDKYNELREKIIEFAKRRKTPLLLYPTISYPEKPRFRIVLFSDYILNEKTYFKAVKWLSETLEHSLTDQFDVNIKMNRNLPIFNNMEQVKSIYSTLDNDELSFLDHKLWSHIRVPKKVEYTKDEIEKIQNIQFTNSQLITATNKIAQTSIGDSYVNSWQFIASLAASVFNKQITMNIAIECCKILASAAANDYLEQKWENNNIETLYLHYNRMKDDIDNYYKARPLISYYELREIVYYRG